ncbi:MAG: M48 family metalloprotease [Planctomycetaceae bacterium]
MYEQIAANKRKTVLLFVGAIAFAVLIGWAIGFIFGTGPAGIVIALVVATVLSIASYVSGDKIVLASTHAREVTPQEQPRLHNVVEGIAIAAGLPKPRVYVVPEQAPNAFATGRDPEHSSIAVTEGLLAMMNRVELEGVIAHEMSHVQDRDILVGTVVATVVGAAVLLSEFFMRAWFWGGVLGGGRDRRGGGGGDAGVVGLILLVVGFVLLALAPLAGQVIKLSVSRNREYLADAQGAMLTRYPPGLASALEKIRDAPHAMRDANNATAHLWLEQPSRVPGPDTSRLEQLFSTHPPIEERIRRLKEM